jgi:hypothetical protein
LRGNLDKSAYLNEQSMENEISSLNKEKKLLKKQIEMQKALYDEKIQLLEEKNKKYKIRLTE